MLPPPPINLISLIDTGNKKNNTQAIVTNVNKPKNEWTLEDYRMHSPNELIVNEKLYNDLLIKEGLV
jgi:hypothetical protein